MVRSVRHFGPRDPRNDPKGGDHELSSNRVARKFTELGLANALLQTVLQSDRHVWYVGRRPQIQWADHHHSSHVHPVYRAIAIISVGKFLVVRHFAEDVCGPQDKDRAPELYSRMPRDTFAQVPSACQTNTSSQQNVQS